MGRFKLIDNPDKMWSLFQEYKKDVKERPITKHCFVGKDGNSDYEKRERPLTLVGFQNYCFEVASDVHHYFENPDNRYDDFRGICSRIRASIRQDQIEGGMAGIYNPSITQRLNSLTEKTENKDLVITTTVSKEEAIQIAKDISDGC